MEGQILQVDVKLEVIWLQGREYNI